MSTNTEQFKTEQKARWANGKRANGANFAQLFDAIARLIEDEVTSVPATDIPAAIKDFLDNSDKYNNTDAVAKLKEAMKKPETLKETLGAVEALDASDATKTAIVNALKALVPATASEDFLPKLEKVANYDPRFVGGEGGDDERIAEALKKVVKNFGSAGQYIFQAGMGEVKIWKYSNNSEAEVLLYDQNATMDLSVQNEFGFAVPYINGTISNVSALGLPANFDKLWLLTSLDGARYVYDNSAHTLTPAVSLIG